MHRRQQCRSRCKCRRRSFEVVLFWAVVFAFSQVSKPFLRGSHCPKPPSKTPHGRWVRGMDWLPRDVDAPLVWTDRFPYELGAWPHSMFAPEPRRNRRLSTFRDFGDIRHRHMLTCSRYMSMSPAWGSEHLLPSARAAGASSRKRPGPLTILQTAAIRAAAIRAAAIRAGWQDEIRVPARAGFAGAARAGTDDDFQCWLVGMSEGYWPPRGAHG